MTYSHSRFDRSGKMFEGTSLSAYQSIDNSFEQEVFCKACNYRGRVQLYTMSGDWSSTAIELAKRHSHTKESIEVDRKKSRQRFLKSRRYNK